MKDVLYICRCFPYEYFFITPDRNVATQWAIRNRSSAGERQVKRIRWNMLANAKGVVLPFKPITKEELETDMAELKTIIGGATPPGGNWLSELEIGTVFLAKDRTSADFSLMHLMILDKTLKSVKLASPELPTPRFVDPSRFCQKYMWHETLGVIKEEDIATESIEKEPEGEQRNRSEEQ